MDARYQGKTVIITGGSEGVGAAAARKFAAAGANLVVVARGKRKLEAIADELRPVSRILTIAMDVADHDACINLFKKAQFEFGSINILVNNAGYHERGPVETVDAEALGKMIDVNLRAPIILSRLALPYLREADGAAIINVASLYGRAPVPGVAAYSASKFGLRAFTFALGDELRGSGIKLGVVSPGPIDTGFIMSNIDSVGDLTFSQPISSPEDVAGAIMDLVVNSKRERCMPPSRGLLTTIGYLFPSIGHVLLPLFERKGRNVKRKLKAKMRAAAGGQET